MKALPAPDVLVRQWLHNPHAITVAAFAIAGVFLGVSGWFIQRNLRYNDPGLRTPFAFVSALIIAAAGVLGANRLPFPWPLPVGTVICVLASLLFYYADHRRFVRDPAGKIVADRWRIVLAFAGFQWTRDKANRHFFFSGDTGSGKTSGMNGLLAALIRRNPKLGGVVMANKGDEWFYLEWLAKKYGRENDIIRLHPRLIGESGPSIHRLNVTGDTRRPLDPNLWSYRLYKTVVGQLWAKKLRPKLLSRRLLSAATMFCRAPRPPNRCHRSPRGRRWNRCSLISILAVGDGKDTTPAAFLLASPSRAFRPRDASPPKVLHGRGTLRQMRTRLSAATFHTQYRSGVFRAGA